MRSIRAAEAVAELGSLGHFRAFGFESELLVWRRFGQFDFDVSALGHLMAARWRFLGCEVTGAKLAVCSRDFMRVDLADRR